MRSFILFFLMFLIYCTLASGQDISDILQNYDKYILIPHTPVKDQYLSSTCWSFGTISFIESELIRQGKGEYDLSEIFVARKTYINKVKQHIRMHGYNYFTPGGQSHDVMKIISEDGLITEEGYSGLINNATKHNHDEMDSIIKNIVDRRIKSNIGFDSIFLDSINEILDKHLGVVPLHFPHNGIYLTLLNFSKDILNIETKDYIQLTSYSHHPYYQWICLESPYNWSNGLYYNIPFTEFIWIFNTALTKGYSLAWNGDVSANTFIHQFCTAYLDDINVEITQESRQISFNNRSTKIDHIMHIVGVAYNANGNKSYITKNSWGDDTNLCKGYIFMSEDYVKLKTVSFMVHREVIEEVLTDYFE